MQGAKEYRAALGGLGMVVKYASATGVRRATSVMAQGHPEPYTINVNLPELQQVMPPPPALLLPATQVGRRGCHTRREGICLHAAD